MITITHDEKEAIFEALNEYMKSIDFEFYREFLQDLIAKFSQDILQLNIEDGEASTLKGKVPVLLIFNQNSIKR